MTEEDIREVAHEAAREAVRDMMERLGLNPDDYRETQQDFAHLRAWRNSMDNVKRQTMVVSVGIAVAGLLALIWQALKY
jgi:hypothetical protein